MGALPQPPGMPAQRSRTRGLAALAVLAAAGTALLAAGTGSTARSLQSSTAERLEQHASAADTATRVSVPLPPALPYPAGRCDHLTPGLPGLTHDRGPWLHRLIGHSVTGRPLWAELWGPEDAEQVVVVLGQVHGNECAPTLVTEAIRRSPPTSIAVWLIPTMNPDGYAASSRGNAAGRDLNADGGHFSQPESAAIRDFIAEIRPRLTIHLHSPNGFAGTHPRWAPTANRICRELAVTTAIRCAGGGAGTRADRNRWFLWQGLERYGGESLLVELRAVSDLEVAWATPRPPTRSVAEVRADAEQLMRLVAAALTAS